MMEIEAKFRADDDQLFQALRGLATAGPFRLACEPGSEDQRNTYFDTADKRLHAGRYGLRVRAVGARRVATLKGAPHGNDGIAERPEWEVEIGADDQPESWPASETRDRVLAITGGAAIQPILTIHTLRQHIYVYHGAARFAEISLDEGTMYAGGRAERFREVEIELLAEGDRVDFDALVALLRDRFALMPEDRSKLARGLALLDATSI